MYTDRMEIEAPRWLLWGIEKKKAEIFQNPGTFVC